MLSVLGYFDGPFVVKARKASRRSVCRPPLVGVSGLCHKVSGIGVDLHEPVKILLRSLSNFHTCFPVLDSLLKS